MSGPEGSKKARRGQAGARSITAGPAADRNRTHRVRRHPAAGRGLRRGQGGTVALTPTQLAALVVATAIAYVANAGPSRMLIPAFRWPRATGADLSARAVVSTIPGPTDVATRFVLYRQWAIPADTASAGIVFAAFFETLSALVLPLIATSGVVVTARRPDRRYLLILLRVRPGDRSIGFLVGLVRSEPGPPSRRVAQRARLVWRLFRQTPPSGIVEGVIEVRERSKDILSRHGFAGLRRRSWPSWPGSASSRSHWSVGVTPDILPPSAVLAAMAVVGLVALIPITPGAVGVTEVAYIGVLTAWPARADGADHGRHCDVPDRPVAGTDPDRLDRARDHAR